MQRIRTLATAKKDDMIIYLHEFETNDINIDPRGSIKYAVYAIDKGSLIYEGYVKTLKEAKEDFIGLQDAYFGKVLVKNILS